MKRRLSNDECEYLIGLVVHGLTTNNAHHKQHILEEVLLTLTSQLEFESLKRSHDWEEGVPA